MALKPSPRKAEPQRRLFVTLDQNGRVLGFYDSTIHTPAQIPDGAREISESTRQMLLQSNGLKGLDPKDPTKVAPIDLPPAAPVGPQPTAQERLDGLLANPTWSALFDVLVEDLGVDRQALEDRFRNALRPRPRS